MQKLKLLIALCFITTLGWSQGITVKGVVSDESGGLPGASIIVKGSETTGVVGTVADLDGNFTLNVDANDVLVVSFLGYTTLEVPVAGKTTLSILLEPDAESLEELVVVGYGTQKKASSVAAIAQAKGEELLKVGSVNTVTEALQGMMPGVTSIVSSGTPGAEATEIFIRGKASWQGSSPLILVDGVERDMNDVDPNEIETISVLKDASATAVFGIKGGNGVILVTTKRGTISKPSVSLTANFGFKNLTSLPEYEDHVTSMELYNESLINDNQWSSLIPQTTIDAWKNAYATGNYGPYNDQFPEVDWWDEVVRKVGYQQQYNMNVRGGTDFVKYFVSLGYLHDGDMFKTEKNDLFDPRFYYNRFNWRSNFDLNLTKSTILKVNLAGKMGYRNQPGFRLDGNGESGFGLNQFYSGLWGADRNVFPIYYSDGYYGVPYDGGGDNISGNYVQVFDKGQRKYKYTQSFLDFKLNQKLDFITKGLGAKASFSYSSATSSQSSIQASTGGNFGPHPLGYYRTYDYANPNDDGTYPLLTEVLWPNSANFQTPEPSASYDSNLTFNTRIYYELALTYARTFGDHNVTGLALFSRRETKGKSYQVQNRQEDWVGRVTYSYKDRYLAEVNGSYNGSEAFAPGLRFGAFYSGSVGWRISEEPIVKRLMGEYLTNFKVRYSYGTVGVDGNNRFLYQQSYNNNGGTEAFGYDVKQTYGPIYYEGDAANDKATWETAYKQNLGFEMSLISKLTGSLDLYKESREGILMDTWSPVWYLPTSRQATGNIGETKNHGFELELGWSDKIGSNIRYWVKGNMARNENRIVYRQDGTETPAHQQQAGKPIGWQTRYINTDLYQSLDDIYNYATPNTTATQATVIPGDMMYVDYNVDGQIDENDKVVTENVAYPLNTYGMSFGGSYKGFDLRVVFYGVSDYSKTVPVFTNTAGGNGVYQSYVGVLDRWTYDNTDATQPSLHSTSAAKGYNNLASTYQYQNASYIRLKNVELSYRFDKKVAERLRMKKLQIYTNGNNLYTWTRLNKYLDPETKGTSVYPLTRRFNVGVRASF